MVIYIDEKIENKDLFDWIKLNYKTWTEEANKAYREGNFAVIGWVYNPYKKCVTSTKKLKYWGMVDGFIRAILNFNGKRLTISIKEVKGKEND